MPQERKQLSDVLKPKPFYPDLPRIDKQELIGKPIVIYDWIIIKDWNSSEYGSSSFAIIAWSENDQVEATGTSIISGVAVLKTLNELQRKGIKNVECRLILTQTEKGNDLWKLL